MVFFLNIYIRVRGLIIVHFLTVLALQMLILSLLCRRFLSTSLLFSHLRSCRSRMSVPSSWRAACAGSRESCRFGWSSCREARRGWGTTVRGPPCPPRGQTLTEVRLSGTIRISSQVFGHSDDKIIRLKMAILAAATLIGSFCGVGFNNFLLLMVLIFAHYRGCGGWCGKHRVWLCGLWRTEHYAHWCRSLLLQYGQNLVMTAVNPR